MRKAGMNQVDTAYDVGVNKSTISRELGRNIGLRGYPDQAQQLARARRYGGQARMLEAHCPEIERLLKQQWSPEQIAWRLYSEQGFSVSHEWKYLYIYRHKRQEGQLYRNL